MISILVVAYPVIIYYFLSYDLPWLGVMTVMAIVIWKLRHRSDRILWITGLTAGAFTLGYILGPEFVSKSVPVLIHVFLFFFFWQSLNGTPLITQFAQLEFPDLPRDVAEYCRGLTKIWTGFFAVNIFICTGLALYSDDKHWAIYNSLVIYVLITLLVVGEVVWRKIRFPNLDVPPFRQSIENIVKNGHTIWSSNNGRVGHSR